MPHIGEILGQPFRGLSEALDLGGSAAGPGKIDLSAAIPVLELGRTFMRYNNRRIYQLNTQHAHVGVGAIRSVIDPWNSGFGAAFTAENQFGPLKADDELMLYGTGATVSDVTDFESAQVGLAFRAVNRMNNEASQAVWPLWLSAGTLNTFEDGTGSTVIMAANNANGTQATPWPIAMRQGDLLSFRSSSDTAGTVDVMFFVTFVLQKQWIGGP